MSRFKELFESTLLESNFKDTVKEVTIGLGAAAGIFGALMLPIQQINKTKNPIPERIEAAEQEAITNVENSYTELLKNLEKTVGGNPGKEEQYCNWFSELLRGLDNKPFVQGYKTYYQKAQAGNNSTGLGKNAEYAILHGDETEKSFKALAGGYYDEKYLVQDIAPYLRSVIETGIKKSLNSYDFQNEKTKRCAEQFTNDYININLPHFFESIGHQSYKMPTERYDFKFIK